MIEKLTVIRILIEKVLYVVKFFKKVIEGVKKLYIPVSVLALFSRDNHVQFDFLT
jgi:hypothetical protein